MNRPIIITVFSPFYYYNVKSFCCKVYYSRESSGGIKNFFAWCVFSLLEDNKVLPVVVLVTVNKLQKNGDGEL